MTKPFPLETEPGAVVPPPPPASAAEPAPADPAERIAALRTELGAADAATAAAYTAYVQALDRFLGASGGDADELITRWSTAQSTLSRFSLEVDRLRRLGDEAATLAAVLARDTADMENSLAAGTLVEESGTAAARRQTEVSREENRLAVLTPTAFGPPSPAPITVGGRSAFTTLTFATSGAVIGPALPTAVKDLRAQVPDVAFDLVAHGPAGTAAAQQTALRRVMAAFRQGGIAPDRMVAALAGGDETTATETVAVRVYLRKTSL